MLRLKDKIEASVTYADRAGTATTADSAKVATKLGSSGVGSMANFIYLNAGIRQHQLQRLVAVLFRSI